MEVNASPISFAELSIGLDPQPRMLAEPSEAQTLLQAPPLPGGPGAAQQEQGGGEQLRSLEPRSLNFSSLSEADGERMRALLDLQAQVSEMKHGHRPVAAVAAVPGRPSSAAHSVTPDALISPASASAGGASSANPGLSGSLDQLLLADGRLETAKLEGENEALKKTLRSTRREIEDNCKRTREIEEAIGRRRVVGSQVKAAQVESSGEAPHDAPDSKTCEAASASLRRLWRQRPSSAQNAAAGCGSSAASVCSVGSVDLAAVVSAARPEMDGRHLIRERLLAAAQIGTTTSSSSLRSQVAATEKKQRDARERLLQKTAEVEKRLEQILTRRGGKFLAILSESETALEGSTLAPVPDICFNDQVHA